MTPPAPSVPPESLLAHSAWMRRLARGLVRDDAQADDVVQDAFVAALRAPPRDAVALPAWLATAVRNGARQLWRGEGRRGAREAASARAESTPGAAEVVARAEEHGLVVQAVLALDEPYRSTLLLRFYDDLPPRDVAARTGVPVETARARIRRGLEQLRGRLDRAHGGDGRAWKLALMPLALHKTAASIGAGTGAAAGHQLTTGAMVMAGTGTVAGVGALALAIGVATGWWMGATKSDAILVDQRKLFDAVEAQVTELERLHTESEGTRAKSQRNVDDLLAKLSAAKLEAETLRKERDDATTALDAAKAAAKPAPVAAAPKAKGPRFAFGQFGKLADIDWKSIGENLNALAPACDDLMKELKATGDISPESFGRMSKYNTPLAMAAMRVASELPGTGPNGSFTHPAFQANAIAAALDAAGKPLTTDEATALEKLARDFTDEDARRLQGYDVSAATLQKTLDEADLRRRFFEQAFAALTSEQRDTLTPPSIKGLVGFDLFSDGLIWSGVTRPLEFKEKETDAFVTEAAGAIQSGLKIPHEQQDAVRAVVAKWAHDLPASLVAAPADGSASKFSMHVDAVRDAARQTIALLQRLVADLKLEGAQAEAARKWPAVLMPLPQRGE